MIDTHNSDAQRRQRHPLQFGLRTLIVATTVIALFIVFSGRIYDWYTSIPMSQAVKAFNMRMEKSRPEYGGPLSEDEVVKAIESQLPSLDASAPVRAIFTQIARTRRLPNNAAFDVTITEEGVATTRPPNTRLWTFYLYVMTDSKSVCELRIRETEATD
jgi:hypothetical protein